MMKPVIYVDEMPKDFVIITETEIIVGTGDGYPSSKEEAS